MDMIMLAAFSEELQKLAVKGDVPTRNLDARNQAKYRSGIGGQGSPPPPEEPVKVYGPSRIEAAPAAESGYTY